MLLLSTVNGQQCGLALLVFCLSRSYFLSLTEPTDLTDVIASRVFSPTDYTDDSDFNSSFFSITRFARDFVLTRHNPNKFGFCSRLLQNSLFDCVKGALRIYTDVTRFARSDA